jgi:hypothetical protein
MNELIKNLIIQVNSITEGNSIFVGNISAYFNNVNVEISDVDVVLRDTSYIENLKVLGTYSTKPDLHGVFGANIGRHFIKTPEGILIDIFIHNQPIEIKENNLEGNIIKTHTLADLITFYQATVERTKLIESPSLREHGLKIYVAKLNELLEANN